MSGWPLIVPTDAYVIYTHTTHTSRSTGVGVALERRPETKAVMVPRQLLAWGLAASSEAAAATTSRSMGGYVFVCVWMDGVRTPTMVCGDDDDPLPPPRPRLPSHPSTPCFREPAAVFFMAAPSQDCVGPDGQRRTGRSGVGGGRGRSIYVQILLRPPARSWPDAPHDIR